MSVDLGKWVALEQNDVMVEKMTRHRERGQQQSFQL